MTERLTCCFEGHMTLGRVDNLIHPVVPHDAHREVANLTPLHLPNIYPTLIQHLLRITMTPDAHHKADNYCRWRLRRAHCRLSNLCGKWTPARTWYLVFLLALVFRSRLQTDPSSREKWLPDTVHLYILMCIRYRTLLPRSTSYI